MEIQGKSGYLFWIIRILFALILTCVLLAVLKPYEVQTLVSETKIDVPPCPQRNCDCSGCPSAKVKGKFKVPNIVHYTWYVDETVPMTFKQYLGVLSASKVLKPDKIYIHMNITRPPGEYFDKILALPNVEAKNEGLPHELFGKKILDNPHFPTDYSDIGRLKYLMEFGGIYLDYDALAIRSFDDLRKYDMVLGQEQEKVLSYDFLSNGVIVAAKDSPFLALWAQSYEDDYQGNRWVYNACYKPTILWKRFPQFIHVEKFTIHRPNWREGEIDKIWGNDTFNWKEHYAVHYFYRFRSKAEWYKEHYGELSPSEEDVKTMNNTFGEMARYILSL